MDEGINNACILFLKFISKQRLLCRTCVFFHAWFYAFIFLSMPNQLATIKSLHLSFTRNLFRSLWMRTKNMDITITRQAAAF